MRVEECSTNNHTDNGQPYNNQPPSVNQATRPTTQEGYSVPTTPTSTTTTTPTTITTTISTTTITPTTTTTTTTTSASPIHSSPSPEMGVIAPVNLGSSRGPPLPHTTPQGTSYTLPPAPGVHVVPEATNDPTTTTADPRETSRDPLVGHRAENSRQDRAPVPQGRAPVPQGRAPVPGVTTTLAHRERERLAARTRRLVGGQPVKRKLWDVDHQRVKEELEEELERLLEEEECRFRSRWRVVEGCSTGPAFYCSQVITAEGTEELPTPPVPGPGDIKVTHALAKRRRTQPPFPASASLVLSKGSQLPLVVSQDSGLPQVTSNLLNQRESQQQTYTPPAEAVVTECHSAKSENGSNSVSPTKPASSRTSESAASSSSTSESAASSSRTSKSAASSSSTSKSLVSSSSCNTNTKTPIPAGDRLSLPSTTLTSSVATIDSPDSLSPNVSGSCKSSSGVSSADSTPMERTSTSSSSLKTKRAPFSLNASTSSSSSSSGVSSANSTPTEGTSTPLSSLAARRAPQESFRTRQRPRQARAARRYLRM